MKYAIHYAIINTVHIHCTQILKAEQKTDIAAFLVYIKL